MSSMDIDTSLEYNDEPEIKKENGDHSDSPAVPFLLFSTFTICLFDQSTLKHF